MNAQPPTSDTHIIRRDARRFDPKTEQIITLDPEHPLIRLLRLVIPIGGVRYVVPKGKLPASLAFDGRPMTLRIAETDEEITVHPRLRIVKLAGPDPVTAGTTLCAVLHPHYEEQIAHLRQRISAIFFDVIGLRCSEKTLDGIVDHGGQEAEPILERIRADLGLEVEWVLESDPELQRWIRRLQAALPSVVKQSFNMNSKVNQFNLTYTCKVLSVIPSKRHIARRRAAMGIDPADETEKILALVHSVLDPALGIFTGNIKIWLYPNFWSLLRRAFEKEVSKRVENEFGYNVSFNDFKREPTEAERAVMHRLEDNERMHRAFLDAESLYFEIKEKHREALRDTEFNYDAPRVKRLEIALERAEDELKKAQKEMETASRGVAPLLGDVDSAQALLALTQFHNLLQLDRPDLLNLDDQHPGAAAGQ